MSAVLLTSLGLLLAAITWSLVLLIRTGEMRVGIFTTLFAFLAADRSLALWTQWGAPLAFDAPAASEIAALLACLLGLAALGALRLTLSEREHSDAMHWDSMEAVRALGELASETALDLDQKFEKLLEIGCTRFGLEVGMVSRVKGDRYQVRAVHAPPGFPIARGAALQLHETYCSRAFSSDRPLAIAHAADSEWADHPARAAFRFESYLGSVLRVHGERYGTLAFGDSGPRKRPFTATDKDLLNLMSRWFAFEIERADAKREQPRETGRAEAPPSAAPASARRREPRAERGIDANATLRSLEAKLRQLAGPEVELALSLEPDLGLARAPSVPLERIVLSLAANAFDAMPEGGRLELKTASLEVGGADPGVFPAVAPNHYVTLSVSDTGGGLGADSLSRVFEPSGEATGPNGGEGRRDRLPLPAVYRVLQRCGGDLSVEAEPGRGTTFTLFLPSHRDRGTHQRPRPPAPAPQPGPPL